MISTAAQASALASAATNSFLTVDSLGWPLHLGERLHESITRDSTAIGWTWHVFPNGDYVRGFTFNAWMGCTKVAAECALCYANTRTDQLGRNLWGKNARRQIMKENNWKRLDRMERLAIRLGHSVKVFCHSMSDAFEILCEGHPDAEAMEAARERLFAEIERHPHLNFILCTKRPFNVMRLVPERWRAALPSNVWVLATTGTQGSADRLIPELLKIPAAVLGLSVEPMLTPVVLPQAFLDLGQRGWVIAGGESGNAVQPVRPTHPDWFRALRDQCDSAGVPFFFKQVGDWTHDSLLAGSKVADLAHRAASGDRRLVRLWLDGTQSYRLTKQANGRELDGREWNQFPRSGT